MRCAYERLYWLNSMRLRASSHGFSVTSRTILTRPHLNVAGIRTSIDGLRYQLRATSRPVAQVLATARMLHIQGTLSPPPDSSNYRRQVLYGALWPPRCGNCTHDRRRPLCSASHNTTGYVHLSCTPRSIHIHGRVAQMDNVKNQSPCLIASWSVVPCQENCELPKLFMFTGIEDVSQLG